MQTHLVIVNKESIMALVDIIKKDTLRYLSYVLIALGILIYFLGSGVKVKLAGWITAIIGTIVYGYLFIKRIKHEHNNKD